MALGLVLILAGTVASLFSDRELKRIALATGLLFALAAAAGLLGHA